MGVTQLPNGVTNELCSLTACSDLPVPLCRSLFLFACAMSVCTCIAPSCALSIEPKAPPPPLLTSPTCPPNRQGEMGGGRGASLGVAATSSRLVLKALQSFVADANVHFVTGLVIHNYYFTSRKPYPKEICSDEIRFSVRRQSAPNLLHSFLELQNLWKISMRLQNL